MAGEGRLTYGGGRASIEHFPMDQPTELAADIKAWLAEE
jgi:hypothetical protein